MTQPSYNVLFLCQHNAGRSLMAEAMLNKMGHGRFNAFSAGFEPESQANPIAIQVLTDEGFDTSALRPKHYSVFLEEDAPPLDFIFTLCADSQQEAKLDTWDELSNDTITAHWHFSEPHQSGSDALSERHRYSHVQRELAQRIRLFLNLPDDKLLKLANEHQQITP